MARNECVKGFLLNKWIDNINSFIYSTDRYGLIPFCLCIFGWMDGSDDDLSYRTVAHILRESRTIRRVELARRTAPRRMPAKTNSRNTFIRLIGLGYDGSVYGNWCRYGLMMNIEPDQRRQWKPANTYVLVRACTALRNNFFSTGLQ